MRKIYSVLFVYMFLSFLFTPFASSAENVVSSWVDVKAFGAKGDGATDDTTAIQAAIDYASSHGVTYQFIGAIPASRIISNQSHIGSKPTVYLPAGRYKITDSLRSAQYVRYRGDYSIIQSLDNTVDLVTGVKYGNSFNGLAFVGGSRGLYVQTSNLDKTIIEVNDCEFRDNITASIAVDNNSASTSLYIHNSKFANTIEGSYILHSLGCDPIVFDRNWVTTGNKVVFYNGAGSLSFGSLIISNMTGVPVGTKQVWIKNYGVLRLYNNRFGGETSAHTIVENHVGNGHVGAANEIVHGITMVGNTFYGFDKLVNFYRIPSQVYIMGNFYGVIPAAITGTRGLSFDEKIPDTDYVYHTAWGQWTVENYLQAPLGPNMRASQFAQLRNKAKASSKEAKVTDMHFSINNTSARYGSAITASGVTSVVSNDKFGVPGYRTIYSKGNAYIYRRFNTALSNLPSAGFYTASFNVTNYGLNSVSFGVKAGIMDASCVIQQSLPVGEHVISVPFYWNGTDNALGYNIEPVQPGDDVLVSRISVWKGIIEKDEFRSVVNDDAAPKDSKDYRNWYVGDVVQNTGSDNVILWKCTTAGAPGTWKALTGVWE